MPDGRRTGVASADGPYGDGTLETWSAQRGSTHVRRDDPAAVTDALTPHPGGRLARRRGAGGDRLSDDALAKKKGRSNNVRAEDKLGIGERCDPPKDRHGERHNCNDCRTGFSVAYQNTKGKTVRKCACKPAGQGASTNEAWQCCSGQSDGSQCIDPPGTTAAVSPPPSPPPPPGPPGPAGAAAPPPPVWPAVCPVCQTCNPGISVCGVDPSENGQPGTGCAAPKVCCGGTCCDNPVRACTDAGTCATCADVCAPECFFCYHLAEGRTVCGDGGGTGCTECSSSAQSPGTHPHCVLSALTG